MGSWSYVVCIWWVFVGCQKHNAETFDYPFPNKSSMGISPHIGFYLKCPAKYAQRMTFFELWLKIKLDTSIEWKDECGWLRNQDILQLVLQTMQS